MDSDSNFLSAWVTITHSVANGDPITYGDLGSVLGLHPRNRQLSEALQRIRDVCETRRWPDLTLSVVLAMTGLPSPRRPGPVYDRRTWEAEWARITAWDWPSTPPHINDRPDDGSPIKLRLEVPRDMADTMRAELRRQDLSFSETILKATTVPSIFDIETGIQTVGTVVAAVYAVKGYYENKKKASQPDLAEVADAAGRLLGSDPSFKDVVMKLPDGTEVHVSRSTQEQTGTAVRKSVEHRSTSKSQEGGL